MALTLVIANTMNLIQIESGKLFSSYIFFAYA